MNKNSRKFIWILSCIICLYGCNQGLSPELKSRYYSESVKVGIFDESLFDSLALANKEHPARFYMICSAFLKDSMMNEAAVTYLIGKLRYKLYNKTNPDYEASGDGALAGSFAMAFGFEFKEYLNKNLDNYGEIMQQSGDWYQKNKHFYFKHPENELIYDKQTKSFFDYADTLLNHPTSYIQKLENERKELEVNLKKLKSY